MRVKREILKLSDLIGLEVKSFRPHMGIWGLSQKGTTLLVKDASRILSHLKNEADAEFADKLHAFK